MIGDSWLFVVMSILSRNVSRYVYPLLFCCLLFVSAYAQPNEVCFCVRMGQVQFLFGCADCHVTADSVGLAVAVCCFVSVGSCCFACLWGIIVQMLCWRGR